MTRDIRQDPHPGDVVQVYPPLDGTPPAPLTVLSVTDRGVRWYREGQGERVTRRSLWSGDSTIDIGPRCRLELVEMAP